jgi:hypothetical protein
MGDVRGKKRCLQWCGGAVGGVRGGKGRRRRGGRTDVDTARVLEGERRDLGARERAPSLTAVR